MRALLPRPRQVHWLEGTFETAGETPFVIPEDSGLTDSAVRLALDGSALQLEAAASTGGTVRGLCLEAGHATNHSDSPERYCLEVSPAGIRLIAPERGGFLAGLHTLAQLALDGPPPCCRIVDWPAMTLRGTHFCYHLARESLAYNVPNFDALMQQADRMAAVKQNAALVELESLFPWRNHPGLACALAFTREELARLRGRLAEHGMQVIPLVQCLGHAYNVLVNDAYAHLRELPDRIQQFCATNPAVADLYMEFVDEYLEVFPDIRLWHLGGDESYLLGKCPRCAAKVEREGYSKLYVDHVGGIARRVAERGLTPIVWSDMLEHHPEAIDDLPPEVAVMYWNYDLPHWPRPYYARLFSDRGRRVIGASGVRFGASGTELSVYYPEALAGIESLTGRLHADGIREIVTTNWMKGSPHENTDYGLCYAAEMAWNPHALRQDFQRRYARWTFGLDDYNVCDLYETLSLRHPYAQPVQHHQRESLNRFDLSGRRFADQWAAHTKPETEPAVREELRHADRMAAEAREALWRYVPRAARGERQLRMLALSADAIRAKSRVGLLLHEGARLEDGGSAEAILDWCARLPAALGAWMDAKERHRREFETSGFAPSVAQLNEMMFEPAERDALSAMGARLAGSVAEGLGPGDLAIPVFDNDGPPYERGLEHGRVFGDRIAGMVAYWSPGWESPPDSERTALLRMKTFVAERFPEIAAELSGIADGAGLPFDAIFHLNCFNAAPFARAAACSTILRSAGEGAVLLAKTTDVDAPQRRAMVWRRIRQDGAAIAVLGWIGTVWTEVALTSRGLAVGANSAPAPPDQGGWGIPQHFGLYPVLFQCVNVREAVDYLSALPFAGKGLVMGLADAEGGGAIVEKSGALQGVRWLQGAGIVGVNDFETAGMRPLNAPLSAEMSANCQGRRDRFARHLADATEGDGMDSLLRLLADDQSPGAFCQTGQCHLETAAAVIADPIRGEIWSTGRPPSEDRWLRFRV